MNSIPVVNYFSNQPSGLQFQVFIDGAYREFFGRGEDRMDTVTGQGFHNLPFLEVEFLGYCFYVNIIEVFGLFIK